MLHRGYFQWLFLSVFICFICLNAFVYTGLNAFVYTGLNAFVHTCLNTFVYTGLNVQKLQVDGMR